MTYIHDSHRDECLSRGGWSSEGECRLDEADDRAIPSTGHPFATDDQCRYQAHERIGRGGMGEVLLAYDRRLGRDVALKRVVKQTDRNHDELARRLAREACVTARLEHPAIVPVYDAGVDGDGHLFYTMRFVHGESLAEALAQPTLGANRPALLRHFLAVCQAVAYAHQQGIVHRDLKPANVMVGRFGETQVVDWGLAMVIDGQDIDGALRSERQQEMPSHWVGTPAYMSPEQRAGRPVDRRTDVWALGAILFEIATGARLDSHRGSTSDEAAGTLAPTPNIVGELRAIIAKATAHEQRSRYPSAAALADDVESYLDGRRVSAHAYTTSELFGRLIRRLRVPLLVTFAALIAAGLALAANWQTVTRERSRAVLAEKAARQALANVETTSAWALTKQSVAELAMGNLAQAELLAAHALVREESADARGVMAAAYAGAVPSLATAIALPHCNVVTPYNWDSAVCQHATEMAFWNLVPARERWRIRAEPRAILESPHGMVVVDADDKVRVIDTVTGATRHTLVPDITTGRLRLWATSGEKSSFAVSEGRIVTIFDLAHGNSRLAARLCGDAAVEALTATTAGFLAFCNNGIVLETSITTWQTRVVANAPDLPSLALTQAALAPDGYHVVVGGARGDIATLNLQTRLVSKPQRAMNGPVRTIAFFDREPNHVMLGSEVGPTRIWDLAAEAELIRFPGNVEFHASVFPQGIASGGDAFYRWRLPMLYPRTFRVAVGIGAMAIDPKGRFIAIGRSDGNLEIRARQSGRIVHSEFVGPAVVKPIAFSPDGSRLVVANRSEPPFLFEVDTWRRSVLATPPRAVRHLSYDDQGRLLMMHMLPIIGVWSGPTAMRDIPLPEVTDFSASPNRAQHTLLLRGGSIWRLNEGHVTRVPVDVSKTSERVATMPTHDAIAVSHGRVLEIIHPGGRTERMTPAYVTALLGSQDESVWIAAHSNGTLTVWRHPDATLLAILRGHEQRVAHVAFAADGKLVTAGWDGQILQWDLSVLSADPKQLVERAERVWGAKLGR